MLIGDPHHFLDAFREDPFVGSNHLAVLALGGDAPERDVMVFVHVDKVFVIVDSDSGILGGVLPRDLERSIGTAVVADGVVPVGIGLGQHALDAVTEVVLPVINRCHHAHQWRRSQSHVLVTVPVSCRRRAAFYSLTLFSQISRQ
jgi:hypothetical protein